MVMRDSSCSAVALATTQPTGSLKKFKFIFIVVNCKKFGYNTLECFRNFAT